ncbi:hypothetical protein D9M73_101540 [compost metagenome]
MLAVADQHEFVDAERLGDPVEHQHVVARDHRGLVDDKHGPCELRLRSLEPRRVALGHEPFVGENERGDRLALDAGTCRKIGDHLVLESETENIAALTLGDPGDRLQHRRFAGAGDALNGDGAILRRQDQRGRGKLPGIERAIRGRLQPCGRIGGLDDRSGFSRTGLDCLEDALFGAERLLRGDHAHAFVAGADDAGDQLPVLDQLADAVLDGVDRDALQSQIERGLRQQVDVECRLAFGKDPDGGRDGELRAGCRGRLGDAREP